MNSLIKIGKSRELKIRGVIAKTNISKGAFVETIPLLVINRKYQETIDKTPLTNYYYEWDKKSIAFLLGFGSLYNHSYNANAKIIENHKNKNLKIKAVRDINIGEEITINYNGAPNDKTPLDPSFNIAKS